MVWLGHSQPVGACQESGADVQDACREYSDLLCASLNQWSHRRSQQQNPRADQKGFWLSEQRTVQERHLFPLGWLGPLSGPMKKHRNIPEEAFIARIHGRAELPDSMVLYPSAYDQLLQNKAYKDFLATLLNERSCLFLGFSFLDPAIRHVLR